MYGGLRTGLRRGLRSRGPGAPPCPTPASPNRSRHGGQRRPGPRLSQRGAPSGHAIVGRMADLPAVGPSAMNDPRPLPRSLGDDRHQALRQLGHQAHQLRAATRAADHYISRSTEGDRNTGAWLMSCAVGLADDLASELDNLARALREGPPDAVFQQQVAVLRVRAHQLHAAAKAADHFLEQEAHEDRDTGSWLIATAQGLASRLAAEIDDGAMPVRRGSTSTALDPQEVQMAQRISAATAPVAGL
jgi:hypothetical protein